MTQSTPRIVDLTLPIAPGDGRTPTVRCEKWRIEPVGCKPYVANVHYFAHDSMAGTYLDLPAHIEDCNDGLDAATYPVDQLVDIPATVIHLDRGDGSGKIGADELTAVCPPGGLGPAAVLNALGSRRFDRIAPRSVYLGADAVRWLIDGGVRLLVADVFESDDDPQAVFETLFAAGVLTVCQPIHLDRLTSPRVRLTVLAPRFETATQLPCRVVAKMEMPRDE